MWIINNGNVGIGTASPAHKLDVSGKIRSTSGMETTYIDFTGPSSQIGTDTYTNGFYVYDNSAYRMVIKTGTGDVGIGTISPSQKLEAVGIIKSSGSANSLMFSDRTTATNTWEWYSDGNNAGLYKNHNTASTVMTINSSGNVGIGNTSPNNKLEISDTGTGTGSTHLKISRGADSSAVQRIAGIKMGNTASNDGSNWIIQADSSSGYFDNANLDFIHNSAGTPSTRMRITSGGNIGIGDTSVPNRLSVKDTGNLVTRWTGGSTFSLYQNNTDATVLFSANHGGSGTENRFIWQTNAGTTRAKLDENELYIYYSDGSTSMIALRGQGNSYFRVDSTSDKLINFYYGTSNVGQIVTGGTNVLYQSNSDYRLKENVVEMTGALDKVSQLKPSTYNFISQPETQVDGFMAHELQEVVPQAVSGEKDGMNEDGTPKYQGVDHSQIVPLLVGAIQELKAEIETLKAQINN